MSVTVKLDSIVVLAPALSVKVAVTVCSELPASFAEAAAKYGGLTPEDFPLPRLRYTRPAVYTDEMVEDTYNWLTRWGLLSDLACSADLVDNRIAEPASADD